MTVRELELKAAKGRLLGLEMVYRAASGHIGGSLSAMDVLTELYFEVMKVNPEAPHDPERDRFVMSKGHCTPALYPVLALRGYFPESELELFRSIKGHMSGHPDMVHVPGVDMSTGSLGQGLACAGGMALAGKADGKDYRVYALMGDGEIEEGEIWEAADGYPQVQARQPLRHSRRERAADRRRYCRRHAFRAAGRQVRRLRLARHQGRRPRLREPARGLQGSRRDARDSPA